LPCLQSLPFFLTGSAQPVYVEVVELTWEPRVRPASLVFSPYQRSTSTQYLGVRSAGNTLADGQGTDALAHVELYTHQPCSCSVLRSLSDRLGPVHAVNMPRLVHLHIRLALYRSQLDDLLPFECSIHIRRTTPPQLVAVIYCHYFLYPLHIPQVVDHSYG
jgi:hypothetical protein